jgi:basic membrane protein A
MSKSKKLGFVAAKPIPQVLRNINAFTLGARSVDPKITTSVIFTGDWSMAVKEAEATNSLADQGCDVFTMHVDGPKVVVETAAKRGKMVCGYHASQAKLAPQAYLTGAEWNWSRLQADHRRRAQRQAAPQLRARRPEGRLRQELSAYGPMVSEAARKNADAVKAKMMAGSFDIFAGELKDNTGKVVIPKGKVFKQTDVELEGMNYLIEGVIGKASRPIPPRGQAARHPRRRLVTEPELA